MNRLVRKAMSPLLAGMLAAVPVAGCRDGESAGLANATQRPPVAVTVARARQQDVRVELQSVGRLVSLNAPQLASEIDARVVEVLVDEGEPVASGQELVRLDMTALALARREALAAIQQFNASIANEQRRVARYRDLRTRDVLSQERLDDAEAKLAVDQASLAAAEARLAIVEDRLHKARVRSPVNGMVERRHISVGDFAKFGSPLLTVTDMETFRAELPFPETVAALLRVGQPVRLESPVAPGVQVAARIDHIRPQLGAMNQALVAIAEVANPGPWRPQATVNATVLIERRGDAVVVPLLSVVQRPAGSVVYLLQDGEAPTVRQQAVEVGARQDGWIEVRSGVAAGAVVVVEGAHYLSDGARVSLARTGP